MLKCQLNDGRIDNLNGLDVFFERLSVVVVPGSDLNIQDVVVKLLDIIEILQEHVLQVHQRRGPLGAFSATKHG